MDFANERYKKKARKLKRYIKDLVFENAALCDQIALIQEKELIVWEERKFLLRKYQSYQQAATESDSRQFQSQCSQTLPQNAAGHGQEIVAKKSFAKKKCNSESPEGNRSSRNRRSYAVAKAKKLVQPIPLDIAGRPVFPIILGGPTVHSLGEVVIHEGELWGPFSINCGVRQGCILSPMIVLLILEDIIRKVMEGRKRK